MLVEFIKRILNNAPVTGNVIRVTYTQSNTYKVFDVYLVLCVRDIHYVPQIGYNLILNKRELEDAYKRADVYVNQASSDTALGHISTAELVTKSNPKRKAFIGTTTVCQDGVDHTLSLTMQQLDRAHMRYERVRSLLEYPEPTTFQKVVQWLCSKFGRYLKKLFV